MEVIDLKVKSSPEDAQGESVQTEEHGLPTNSVRPLRTGFWILLIGFGGFLIWAALAPLDEGVPSMGSVALDSRRKTLQHFSGGVLKEIHVKEGDSVKEGDVLMRFDDSIALASKSLAESQLKSTDIQIRYLEKMISDLSSMTEEGFYPRNRLLEMQRALAEAQAQRGGYQDKLSAATLELQRATVRAPVTGRVMALQITTIGGVVAQGGRLMEVVPDNEELVVEAQVEPHLIEKIHPGLEAEVRFSALNLRKTPVILGVVQWVSPDKFMDVNNSQRPLGYYMARVIVSSSELKKVGDSQIRPGMPAEVIIKTGERTFFQYLIKPLSDRMATSLKER